jgi:hypothetical protein
MRDLLQGGFRTPATKPGKANSGPHPREILARQPARAAAASVASMTDRQALSRPIRVVAGPELASPSILPFSSSIRARQRVPPPSMPR